MIKKILLTSLCLAAVVSCGNRAPKSELQKKIDSYAVFQIGSPYMEGISDNGKEVLNTWFAGFYPYSNPKYSIVVLTEDGTTGSENCCPVFSSIVEKISKL